MAALQFRNPNPERGASRRWGLGSKKTSLLNVLRQGRKIERVFSSRTGHPGLCISLSALQPQPQGCFWRKAGALPHLYTDQGSGMVDHPCARHAEGHKIPQVSIQTEDKVIAT